QSRRPTIYHFHSAAQDRATGERRPGKGPMKPLIRIGTRGSRLALWQANHVAALLGAHATAEIVEIRTAGDQVRDVPLSQIGGVGRRAQLLHRRPDLNVVNIRGNVETRLQKLIDEQLDALVLAQAGLERLGLADAITEVLDPSWMFPAVGQGALGLECRADDE